jgi:hypothetical protein
VGTPDDAQVERVASAIRDADLARIRAAHPVAILEPVPWPKAGKVIREKYRLLAEAAIRAMGDDRE